MTPTGGHAARVADVSAAGATVAAPAGTSGRRRPGPWLAAAPDMVAVAFAGFSLPAMALLVAGRYEPAFVLPLGLVGAAAAVAAARPWRPDGARFTDRRPLLLLGALVVAAAVVNTAFASEYIFAFRDPATYGVLGRWLVDNPSALMPYDNRIFAFAAGNDPGSLGFGVLHDRTAVYAQGNHLLPALLAVPGWLFGGDAVLHANPVIGALSLASVYALARRLVGEWWGLLAPWALAASMPYLAFVRATYSEPLTMLLLLGGLALLARALASARTVDMFLAGLTLGSAALTRVDSYAALLAVPVGAALWCATAEPHERRHRLGRTAVLVAGVGIPVPIAIYDLAVLSPGYWQQRIPETRLLGVAGAALFVIASVVVALAWRSRIGAAVAVRRRTLGWIAAGVVVAAYGLLASRPLWYVARHASPDMVPNITAMQEGLGLPLDPTRTYDELSVSWLSWYFGWPTVVLGVLGIAMLARRVIVTDDDAATGFALAAVGILSALYLTRVLIYPDQVWAMRRLMPVVIPGVLIGTGWSLSLLWSRGPARRGSRLWWRRLAAGAFVALALGIPTWVSLRLAPVVEYGGQRAEVEALCEALPADAAVLAVDAGGTDAGYVQTIRAFCEVPTSSLYRPPTDVLAGIAAASRELGYTVHVVTVEPADVTWRTPPTPTSVQSISKWSETLMQAPQNGVRYERTIYVGAVAPDGVVDPIGPAP